MLKSLKKLGQTDWGSSKCFLNKRKHESFTSFNLQTVVRYLRLVEMLVPWAEI